MNLSMWILADWLRDYETEYKISDGAMSLRGARLLSGEQPCGLAPDVVYINAASSFFEKSGYQVICVHGNDWLKIRNADVETILNEVLNAFDFYNRWEMQLAQEARSGADPQVLLNLSQEVFRNPSFVLDSLGNVLAITETYPKGSINSEWDYMIEHRKESPNIIADLNENHSELMQQVSQTLEPTILYYECFDYRTICSEIYLDYDKDVLASGEFFINEVTTQFHQGFVQLAGIFQRELSICLKTRRRLELLPHITDLFSALIGGRSVDWERWKYTLATINWVPQDSFRLFMIQEDEEDGEFSTRLVHHLQTLFPSTLFCRYEGHLVMLLNLKFPLPAFWESKFEEILRKTQAYCVYSPAFADLNLLRPAYLQTDAIMCQVPRKPGGLYETLKYAWSSILSQFLRTPDYEALLHPAATTLIQYDKEHDTDFTETLYVFLRHDRSLSKTAQAMFLHRNTLIYRIERIYQLIGSTLDEPEQKEHLLFSLEAMAYRRQKKSAPN